MTRATAGLYGSTEHDYGSLGANASLERDLNRRNTTLSAGVSFSHDTINPEGGRPAPLASMAPVGVAPPRLDGDGQKDVLDLIVGLTQVVDRATLVQVNYSLSRVQGYQTDPYKLVSVVDPVSGDPVDQLFESRPDTRLKHILYGRVKRHLGFSVLDLSYRYMNDDWDITSHTVDLHWRWELGLLRYVQPHLRWYHQAAAGFYRRWLEDGTTPPEHVTADYRLGAMDAYTVGLRYGQSVGPGQNVVARVEYYWQTGESHPPGAPGALADLDLFPTVDAWIVNLGYSIGFGGGS
jgi:hypothetical protein